tara:strand:+ start:1328 stop:1633 length:306 start_codon:yes stop_codon:yes gene_type:complete
MKDVWKRDIPSAVDDAADVMSKYNRQMEMDYTSTNAKTASQIGIRWTPEEASPEVIKEWQETDGKWWADKALLFVAGASLTQGVMLGFMALTMYLIKLGAG